MRLRCDLSCTVVAGLLCTASPLLAQQGGASLPRPDTDYAEPEPALQPLPATAFAMPDVPDTWNEYTTYDGPLFSSRFSFVLLTDYNAFTQDDDSRKQVGAQRNEWDLRTWRLMTHGL